MIREDLFREIRRFLLGLCKRCQLDVRYYFDIVLLVFFNDHNFNVSLVTESLVADYINIHVIKIDFHNCWKNEFQKECSYCTSESCMPSAFRQLSFHFRQSELHIREVDLLSFSTKSHYLSFLFVVFISMKV